MSNIAPQAWKRISRTVLAHERTPKGSQGATRKKIFATAGGGGICRVRVSGELEGGGMYVGHLVVKPTAAIPVGVPLQDSVLGSDGADEIVIANAAECGLATHDLMTLPRSQRTFIAAHIGESDEATPRPVYQINGFDTGSCFEEEI